MAYKQYVPDTSEDWDTYWSQTSIEKELQIVKTDGLQPIFEKYLKKKAINVEAGCGLGKWVIDLQTKGYQILGLDTYVKGLVTLKDYNPDLELIGSDVAKLGFKNNSIDAYISLGVVEHFEEGPQVPLKEAYRTVKPGGIALIEVPYDSPLRIISRFLFKTKVMVKTPVRIVVETFGIRSKRTLPKRKFYEYRYTKHELSHFAHEAGFVVEEMLAKDDLDEHRSIMLWSDFPFLRHSDGELFHLNQIGVLIKKILETVSPFTYSALIVAVCRKQDE